MPMSRYEIRNEFSLADPELYRAADKDDPEALLEGVAMAGLVGVLRQLGDLAEFAAEIFHNLHEDVMATAARGHALAFRVQQLETEIPAIERAFLSQTDHSSFFYHPGVDWHHNSRLESNLVTQGDMPRFIMDSYEECREPPRLFLLDKFDIAGAGACLKRYTDPSFFKVESSEMTSADIQREKKIRKAKRKGPRWRNRETHEVVPTTHAKLHQLFLEERVENGIGNSRGAKLKRKLNGFPFNSKSGKSYMEKILKSPSPDRKVLHDKTVDSTKLTLATNGRRDSAGETFEFRPSSPYRQRGERKRSTPSPDRDGVAQNPPTYDSDESNIDDGIHELPSSHPTIATNGMSSALDKVTGERVVAVDAGGSREGSLAGYESEDMASEIDNFVDAPSTMELEMERDSELRMKREDMSRIQMESLVTDTYEEPHHSRSSGSQSTGDSTMSDVANNSSTKEISSYSSDSPSILADKPQSASSSTKGYLYTDISVNEIVGASSSYQETADEDVAIDHHSKSVVSDDTRRSWSRQASSSSDEFVRKYINPPDSDLKVPTLDDKEENADPRIGPPCVVSDDRCTETNAITGQRSEFEQVTSTLCINESVPNLELSDPEEVVGDRELEAHGGLDEMVSVTDDKETMVNLVINPPFYPRARISGSQSEDDLSRSSDGEGEQLVDESKGENVPYVSSVHDVHHTTETSVKASSDLLHEDEYDGGDWELADDAPSTSHMLNALPTNDTPDTMSSEDGIQEVPESSPDDYPDAARNGYNSKPKGDSPIDVWDDEDSNVSIDSLEKGLRETSLASAHTLTVEDTHSNSSIDNEISLENLKIWDLGNSPVSPMEVLDAHDEDVIPEEDTAISETLPLGTSETYEGAGLQGTGLSHHVSPSDSEALEISHRTTEDLEEPAGASDVLEMDGISLFPGFNDQEAMEITSSADIEPANEIHVLSSKSTSEADTSNTTDITSSVPTVSDDARLSTLVEELDDCFEDSGIHELENEGESDHVEKLGPTKASVSGSGANVCNYVDNDRPKSELSGAVPDSHATTQSRDNEQELLNGTVLENPVLDAPSLPVHNNAEEAVQDKIALPPSQLDIHLLHPVEISPESSPSSPINPNGDVKGESTSTFDLSAVPLANGLLPPSISEVSRLSNKGINVPGYPENPFGSIPSPSNPFLEANQINLSDLPPLPPLPPVQWRMGKLQHTLPYAEAAEEDVMINEESFPQSLSQTAATYHVGSTLPTKPTHDDSSPPTASINDVTSEREEIKDPLIERAERAAETISKEESPDNSCSSSEAKPLPEATNHPQKTETKPEPLATPASESHEATDHPQKIETKPQLLITPPSESVSTKSAAEDGAENGSQKVKFPRPRNPVVDDISFLDKSKLRKVTERVRPEIPKVEERDSLLEQIRTKSFNLKPAMASRPSIRTRAPDTNLKVVAILEKANAIRQAFAGSDEDDDDSWSE